MDSATVYLSLASSADTSFHFPKSADVLVVASAGANGGNDC